MTTHGLLFTAPMVRAILSGEKTQTRRALTSRNQCTVRRKEFDQLDFGRAYADPGLGSGGYLKIRRLEGDEDITFRHRMRSHIEYEDRIWVRETWHDEHASDGPPDRDDRSFDGMVNGVLYRADGDRPLKWRPAIFMPRWASRITLEVTGICVERVQDISEADIEAEGVTRKALEALAPKIKLPRGLSPRDLWERGWRAINGDASWDANPWVWAFSFRML